MPNRDVAALLKAWGFEEAGYTGGHMIMALGGRRVQIIAPSRSTPTPYKALRKAARILNLPLKDVLAGPTHKEKEDKVTEIINIEPFITAGGPANVCGVCGKSDFKNNAGYNAHVSSHVRVRCETCGGEFSQSGIGSHRRACSPAKRGPGRPRKPIAEALESVTTTHRKPGVEVPERILGDLDEDFPSPDAFAVGEGWRTPTVGSIDREEGQVLEETTNKTEVLLNAFFLGRILSGAQIEEFMDWVQTTKTLFDSLSDNF